MLRKIIPQILLFYFLLFLTTSYAQENQERTELIEKRTPYSKTYVNSNGTYTSVISTGFMHYKNENDDFEEIDCSIVQSQAPQFDYEVQKGRYFAYFKSDLSQLDPIEIKRRDGTGLSMQLWGAAYFDTLSKEYHILQHIKQTTASVNSNEIYYHGAFNNVDVKYIYTDNKLKEEILLSQKARERLPDPSNYDLDPASTFLVFITKLNFNSQKISPYAYGKMIHNVDYEGYDRIDFKNVLNEIKFFFPIDFAFLESHRDSISSENMIPIRKRLIRRNGQLFLLSGVPLEWLHKISPGTVVFDPQVQIGASLDAYVYYTSSTAENAPRYTNYGSAENLYIAAWTSSGQATKARAYLKFNLSSIPSNAEISDAKLKTYWHNLSTSGSSGYHGGGNTYRRNQSSTYLKRVTTNWTESGITWVNQPYSTTTHQISITAPSSFTSNFTVTVTQLIKDMINNGNHGFLWQLQSEQYYRSVNLASSENRYTSRRPVLEVTYAVPNETYYIRDAIGSVIAKYVYIGSQKSITYYIRDVNGNVIGTYKRQE